MLERAQSVARQVVHRPAYKRRMTSNHVLSNMAAYDTTVEDEDDDYFSAGTHCVVRGLIELMESDFDRVMAAGLAGEAGEVRFEHETHVQRWKKSDTGNLVPTWASLQQIARTSSR